MILLSNNVFDIIGKLIQIQQDSLKRDKTLFIATKRAIDSTTSVLKMNLENLKTDSIRLRKDSLRLVDSITIYKGILNNTIKMLNGNQKAIGDVLLQK